MKNAFCTFISLNKMQTSMISLNSYEREPPGGLIYTFLSSDDAITTMKQEVDGEGNLFCILCNQV